MKSTYEPVIGLEVHIEPSIKSKMFCSCAADHFAKKPNTQVCPVCLGLPGALPYMNKAGIEAVVKLGLALGSKISKTSRFFRKNYFYPDLPKGYQTSQLTDPFCVGGELLGKRLNHIHLEEDAGKLVHETVGGEKVSLIDFNRSGVALIEMVTEPDFHDLTEVLAFLKEVQLIARYLKVSDADMEKGSMRLEANVSMRKTEDTKLPGYKVELKNINSFKFLEKAVKAELERQEKLLIAGEIVVQETRGYDEVKKVTFGQRSKAEAHDYRYFPEADLPPVAISENRIKEIEKTTPELPEAKRKRFEKEYLLAPAFVDILTTERSRADYFEEAVKLGKTNNLGIKMIADLMVNKMLDKNYPEPAGFVKKIVELTNVDYSSAEDIEKAVKRVLMENEKAITDYKSGNGNVIGFLIGMVQKKLEGKGEIQKVKELLTKELQK